MPGFPDNQPRFRIRNLRAQQRFLEWLREQKIPALRTAHKRMWRLTPKLPQHLPQAVPKRLLIRRCFMHYVLRHWHLGKSNPWRLAYQATALRFLKAVPTQDVKQELELRQDLEMPSYLTWEQVTKLKRHEVERFLLLVGLLPRQVTTLKQLRKALWEVYHIVDPDDDRPSLFQLVIENSELDWVQFQARFGWVLGDDLTRSGWVNARKDARRKGYQIAPHPQGGRRRWAWRP